MVESLTVQSLPRQLRPAAIARVRELVAPGGTLLVIAAVKDEGEDPPDGDGQNPPDGAGQDPPDGAGEDPPDGPWPLTRAEVVSFAARDLELVRLENFRDPDAHRWWAEFRRPPAPQTRSRPT